MSNFSFSSSSKSARFPSRYLRYLRANGLILLGTFGLNKKWTVLLSFDSICLDFSRCSRVNLTLRLIGSFSVPIETSYSVQMVSLKLLDFYLFSRLVAIELYIQSLKSTLSWSLKVLRQWFLSAKCCMLFLKFVDRKFLAMFKHCSLCIVSNYCFLFSLALSSALFFYLMRYISRLTSYCQS